MKTHLALAAFVTLLAASTVVPVQVAVTPAADQEVLLASPDPRLAANKRLVYDMFRIENGRIAEHWDPAQKQ